MPAIYTDRNGDACLTTTIFVKYNYAELAGRNAPSRGEDFRVRIGLNRLKAAANWRVQRITIAPNLQFAWEN